MENETQVYFLFFIAAAAAFCLAAVGVTVLFTRLRASEKHAAEQNETYAGGFSGLSLSQKQFDVRFFLAALLFFILTVAFFVLLLWIISCRAAGGVGLFHAGALFLFCVAAYAYVYKKGALR